MDNKQAVAFLDKLGYESLESEMQPVKGLGITLIDISNFISNQEKYVELGTLIADRDNSINICQISSFNKNCKESCLDYSICKLRAELAEVQK